MPPKRKTSAKKKGKKNKGNSSANSNNQATAAPSNAPPGSYYKNCVVVDSIERYATLSNAFTGASSIKSIPKVGMTLDFVKVSKHLPDSTVESLRDGWTTPEAVADEILSRLNYSMDGFFTVVCQDTEYLGPDATCFLVTKTALGTSVSLQFAFEFFRCLVGNTVSAMDPNHLASFNDFIAVVVKQTFDNTWREWGSRLDDVLYAGQEGAFETECKLFNASGERFVKLVKKQILNVEDDDLDDVRKRIIFTTQGIASGMDQVNLECWQCGERKERHKCTRCQVALYCGKDCQVTAWYDGHKHACESLKAKHAFWKDQLREIDRAHETNNGTLASGVKLSLRNDNSVLLYILQAAYEDTHAGHGKKIRWATIKTFYENIQRIHKGEWWVFADTECQTMAEYNNMTPEDEHLQFESIVRIVATHCFTHADDDDPLQNDYSYLIQNSQGILCTAKQILESFDAPMPRQRFLELYMYECDSKTAEQKRIFRRLMNTQGFRILRTNHHKSTKPSESSIETSSNS